jgi:glyceraldehyde 3-phosphate dehydrogenase
MVSGWKGVFLMAVRVGINGFGRIGRLFARVALDEGDIEVVAVNDLADAAALAHLFKYDSVHGTYNGEVEGGDGKLVIDGKEIEVLSERDPADLPWEKTGVEIAVEATGLFRKRQQAAKHLQAGADKVVITAPATDPDITVVMGVNDDRIDPLEHKIISNASCTTNALVPVVKVLLDSFGVRQAFMTTVHAYTNDQALLDGPHADPRRARAAAMSIIPTSTGAARATGLVMPEMQGKIDGMAMRVPTFDGSVVDLVAILDDESSVQDVNRAVGDAADKGRLEGILAYTEDPVVSIDVVGSTYSSVFDAGATMVLGSMVKVLTWYDNEWGYSNRVVDLVKFLSS